MHKFPPHSKKINIIKEVMSFSQDKAKGLAHSAERYFRLIRKNLVQGISEATVYHIF